MFESPQPDKSIAESDAFFNSIQSADAEVQAAISLIYTSPSASFALSAFAPYTVFASSGVGESSVVQPFSVSEYA